DLQFRLCLAKAVLLEQVDHHWSECDTAPALLRFWLGLDVAVTGPAREDAPHMQRIVQKVNILPLESQDLPSPHPGRESQDKERLHIVPLSGGQQFLGLFGGKRLDLKVRPARG